MSEGLQPGIVRNYLGAVCGCTIIHGCHLPRIEFTVYVSSCRFCVRDGVAGGKQSKGQNAANVRSQFARASAWAPILGRNTTMSDDGEEKKRVKKKSRRLSNDYQTPEYITCDVTAPITHMENGKPSYTDYLITTAV